jgi:hypothetical protein
MRCPKCGYISFDHLATCLNCSKDLSDLSSSAHGTTYNAHAPSFLKFPEKGALREEVEDIEMMPEELDEEFDVVDPDLGVLVEEGDQEIEFNPEGSLLEEDEDDGYSITLDEEDEEESEDREIEIDLSQFEDAAIEETEEAGEVEEEEKFAMDLPDELADLSDLAPPPLPEEKTPAEEEKKEAKDEMELGMLDIDLDLDDETDFSLTSEEKEGGEEGFTELSLDDIGFADTAQQEQSASQPPAQPAPAAAKTDEADMDADLNFDLDLGGLTLPPKK